MASRRWTLAVALALGLSVVPALGDRYLFPQLAEKAEQNAAPQGELQALQGAYRALSAARADYKGHRVKAMQAIGVACTLLGGAPALKAGKPQKNQNQFTSDAQVHEAQALLTGALAMAGKKPRVKAQVNTALNELKKALAAK